jgi:hypothetical protein
MVAEGGLVPLAVALTATEVRSIVDDVAWRGDRDGGEVLLPDVLIVGDCMAGYRLPLSAPSTEKEHGR